MKQSAVVYLVALCSYINTVTAQEKQNDVAIAQRRSHTHAAASTYPQPFVGSGANNREAVAVSSGYYFVDSDEAISDPWKPSANEFEDTLNDRGSWKRIVSGPNQYDASFWSDQRRNAYGGMAFFRNPGDLKDSTDDAFAGPIAIGFPFSFNGVRQDSFYISTNGLIAFSNRRYHYHTDVNGALLSRELRLASTGVLSAYDSQSDDPRHRSGDGMSDATDDSWGYTAVACAGSPSSPKAGIRTKQNLRLDSNGLSAVWGSILPQVVAPAWDDLQVSVVNGADLSVDDFSRVYYKRVPNSDRIVIYFVNLTPIGLKRARIGNQPISEVAFAANNRPGFGEHYRFSVQVTLNGADSSVTVQYDRFAGTAPRLSATSYPANVWMRCNSTVGVIGAARRLDWAGFPSSVPALSVLDYSVPKYVQSTVYLHNIDTDATSAVTPSGASPLGRDFPSDRLAVRFAQHRNMVRAVSVSYRVRSQRAGSSLAYSTIVPSGSVDGYEVLAGDERLGPLQPVALVQSLSNDIQGPAGVNYQRQGIQMRVRCRILNASSGDLVYDVSKVVTDATLRDTNISQTFRANADGTNRPYEPSGRSVLPYEYVKVVFPAFEPNPLNAKHVGTLLTKVSVEALTSESAPIDDRWPFDDTIAAKLHALVRLSTLAETGDGFHLLDSVAIPSPLRWVNIGAEVVDGDRTTYLAPPPIGTSRCANRSEFVLNSPVIRMNRVHHDGSEIPKPGQYGGDELRSFPIDLLGKKGAVLSISYHRTGKGAKTDRGFSDLRLIGPEHRVAMLTSYGEMKTYREPDKLLVEFARPSDDSVTGITNVQQWVLDYQGRRAEYMQPFQIWGGGGNARGFDSQDYNRQLSSDPVSGRTGLMPDLYDEGKDIEFRKLFIPIPDTVFRWSAQGARNFRFRLRTHCLNHGIAGGPEDDNDDFFIDNVKVLYTQEIPDIEMSSIRLHHPYTMAPPTQLGSVPVRFQLSNLSTVASPSFSVAVRITRDPDGSDLDRINCVYFRPITIPTLRAMSSVLLPSPDARFDDLPPGAYTISAKLFFPDSDADSANDSTCTRVVINHGSVLAYEYDADSAINHVPLPQFSGIAGKGLNAPGNRIAACFTIVASDSILGYQMLWGELNSNPDPVEISLKMETGEQILVDVPGSAIVRLRGMDDLVPGSSPQFGRNITYKLPKPLKLNRGRYWISVRQLTERGIELGASADRMGMVTTMVTEAGSGKDSCLSLYADRNLRRRLRSGTMINDQLFANLRSSPSGTVDWFAPTGGTPLLPHLDIKGTVRGFETFTQGSWIPMIRPYFGPRPRRYSWSCFVPVVLSAFDARRRGAAVDLFWQTESELNNAGFLIDRRPTDSATILDVRARGLSCADHHQSKTRPWSEIGFVSGKGTSAQQMDYSFRDVSASVDSAFEYRLRQIEAGSGVAYSGVVSVPRGNDGDVAMDEPHPNPSSGSIVLSFKCPNRSLVRLEIIDALGRPVILLYDDVVEGVSQRYVLGWDGRSNNGTEVPSGAYFCKLTAGGTTVSKVITITR